MQSLYEFDLSMRKDAAKQKKYINKNITTRVKPQNTLDILHKSENKHN